jgi:hypothetical protein
MRAGADGARRPERRIVAIAMMRNVIPAANVAPVPSSDACSAPADAAASTTPHRVSPGPRRVGRHDLHLPFPRSSEQHLLADDSGTSMASDAQFVEAVLAPERSSSTAAAPGRRK